MQLFKWCVHCWRFRCGYYIGGFWRRTSMIWRLEGSRYGYVIMATLPTSLRRTMLMLLVAMSMIVMVFYWNQNTLKPISYINSIFEKSLRNSPTEKSWTYKCNGEKCIRHHYTADNTLMEKRISFMSCAMICGDPNIWPMPTGKTSFSTRSLTLTTDIIKLDIDTHFADVDRLFRAAFDIFLTDLKNLESAPINRGVSSGGGGGGGNTAGGINSQENRDNGGGGGGGQDSNNNKDGGSHLNDEKSHYKKSSDINLLEINVKITTAPDVHLHLDIDESYNLTMQNINSKTTVQIIAKSFFGARNGLASLQQLIWYDDENELLRILSTVLIQDEPKFRYRGLMLDTSRHYFSVDSIKRTIVGMAHSKLNRFHWHITDSQSFPFVSKHYPQMAQYGAYSSSEIYTPDDIREIAEFARVRGIQVIPEIDAPAHAGNGWDWGPKHGLGELSLCINQQPWSFYCGEPPCGQLNPKNNNTYMILQKLYSELLELTGPTDYFHLGGDEVNLECWSQYFNDTDIKSLWCDFMLQAFARLKIANNNLAPKLVSVWSSGLTASQCLSKNNFAVQVWGGSTWSENYELLSNGYNIVISHVDAWYLDCGFGPWRSTGEGACSPYSTWQKVYKHRPWERMRVEPIRMKQILGGEACLWTEQVDESALDSRLWPRVAALAERLWTDPIDDHETDIVPKEIFSRISVFRNRLVELGLKAEPVFPKFCAQNQHECV